MVEWRGDGSDCATMPHASSWRVISVSDHALQGWMKPVTFIGLVIVIFGVAVSSREKLPFKLRCLESRLRSKVGPEVSEDGAVFSLRDP